MLLAHQAQIRRRRHAERLRGSADGKLLAGDDPKLPLIDLETWATKPLALGAGATKAGTDPFHDQAALKLGDGGDDREHCLAQRRARVDLLAQTDELDIKVTKEFQRLDQVPHGSSEAVERRDDHDIDAARLHLAHEVVQSRPALASARDTSVAVLDHVVPPASGAVRPETPGAARSQRQTESTARRPSRAPAGP